MKKLDRIAVSGIMATLLAINMFTLAFNILPVKAEPRTWTVDDDGPADFHKIKDAITAAHPGDTIYVFNGTYYEHTVVISKPDLTLIGENKSITIIDGGIYYGAVVSIASNRVNFTGFTVLNAGQSGLYVLGSAIYLYGVESCSVSDNIVSNSYYGITSYYSRSNTIDGNTVFDTETGIALDNSRNSTVVGNMILNTTWGSPNWGGGISLNYAYNNTVAGNNILNTTEYGIWLNSYNNILTDNTISGTIPPQSSYSGGIHLEDYSHDNTIRGNIISKRGVGIYLAWWSYSNNIVGNTISNITEGDAPYGINAWSPNNNIIGNTITNVTYTGIRLNSPTEKPNHCTNNVVAGNVISKTNQALAVGFVAPSNTVAGNNVSDNYIGLFIFDQSNNNTFKNNFASNNYYGIVLFSSNNSRIYHNNFIDNTQQVLLSDSFNTAWNVSYPSGGNHWSDYTGDDFYNGPFQNETGSDSIGDTPYIIDSDNQDNYPLMTPYSAPDIGITNVTTSRTVVGEGYSISISVKIVNYGNKTETFNITAYANTTSITLQTVTLPSSNLITLTFAWNTTGFAWSNYTISAVADTVLGETDWEDNTFTDDVVLVTRAGDFGTISGGYYDFDDQCDYQDLFLFRKAYVGTYHVLCDFDDNKDVDYMDLFQFRKCYLSP